MTAITPAILPAIRPAIRSAFAPGGGSGPPPEPRPILDEGGNAITDELDQQIWEG